MGGGEGEKKGKVEGERERKSKSEREREMLIGNVNNSQLVIERNNCFPLSLTGKA